MDAEHPVLRGRVTTIGQKSSTILKVGVAFDILMGGVGAPGGIPKETYYVHTP